MNRYELNDRALFINVFTLADFMAEVPPNSVVRLSLTEKTTSRQYTGGYSLPLLEVSLDLHGLSLDYQVIWLHYSQQLDKVPSGDGFLDKTTASFYDQLPRMRDLVRDYLVAHGYQLRPGRYILPDNLKPARGEFECVRFEKTDNTWTVHPVNEDDPSRDED